MNCILLRVILPEVQQNKGEIAVFKLFFHYEVKLSIPKKPNLQDIFKNEEINTIIHAIGAGVGADFEVEDSIMIKSSS